VLLIEVVKLAQKLFGVSNYSMLIAEAGSSCHQVGQSVKTSQSERERRAGEAVLKVRKLPSGISYEFPHGFQGYPEAKFFISNYLTCREGCMVLLRERCWKKHYNSLRIPRS